MQKERSRDCSRYIYGSIRPSWILQHAGYMSASEDLGEDPTLLTPIIYMCIYSIGNFRKPPGVREPTRFCDEKKHVCLTFKQNCA